MVKESYCETKQEFEFNWFQVVQAFWNRYPNPLSTHVLTEDTIYREIHDGKLYTRRILSKVNPLPKWGKRFYNGASVKIIEDSIVDPKSQTLVTFTRNIGCKKIMKVDEKVEYCEGKNGKTIVTRSAWISSQVFGFSRAIRAFGIERFKSNCKKTIKGFNFVLYKMFPVHVASIDKIHKLEHSVLQQQQDQQQQKQQIQLSQQQSKITKIRNAGHSTYSFMKNQAGKIYQLFSVRN